MTPPRITADSEFSVTTVAPEPLRHIEIFAFAGRRPVVIGTRVFDLDLYLAVYAEAARATIIGG